MLQAFTDSINICYSFKTLLLKRKKKQQMSSLLSRSTAEINLSGMTTDGTKVTDFQTAD